MNYQLHCHRKKIHAYFLLPVILLLSLNMQPVYAGELHIDITDGNRDPVSNAVAALVPVAPVNYNHKPTAIMDQRNNMFVPGVLAVRVNTLVNFPNSDDVRHHVYSFSPAKKFELRLYHGKTADPVLFDQAGKVALGCNIHDSMVGYIYVVNSEYFAVTDAKGKITLDKIPAGDYQLEIYHPKLSSDYPTEKIHITDQTIHKAIRLNGIFNLETNQSADEFSELFQ